MKIIFYSPLDEKGNIYLNKLVNNFTIIKGLEIYRAFDDLTKRLCSPGQENTIVVLLLLNNRMFNRLFPVKDLLSKNKIILVLPDHSSDTLEKAHKFKPRFISYTDTDFKYISNVIDKMTAAELNTAPNALPYQCAESTG